MALSPERIETPGTSLQFQVSTIYTYGTVEKRVLHSTFHLLLDKCYQAQCDLKSSIQFPPVCTHNFTTERLTNAVTTSKRLIKLLNTDPPQKNQPGPLRCWAHAVSSRSGKARGTIVTIEIMISSHQHAAGRRKLVLICVPSLKPRMTHTTLAHEEDIQPVPKLRSYSVRINK